MIAQPVNKPAPEIVAGEGIELDKSNPKRVVIKAQNARQTVLQINGGNSSTTFSDYVLRFDFGANGSKINPTGSTLP